MDQYCEGEILFPDFEPSSDRMSAQTKPSRHIIQTMKTLLEYIYYRIYAWNLRVHGKEDVPQWNAMFGIGFLVFLNVITVTLVLDEAFSTNLLFSHDNGKMRSVILAIIIMVVNYFWLVNNQKYLIIEDRFKKMTNTDRKKMNFYSALYVLISVIIMVLAILLLRKFKV